MITEYHIQLLTRKMDEIIANQKELIGLLKAEQETVNNYTKKTEVTMEPQETTIDVRAVCDAEQTPNESVTIAQDEEAGVSTAASKDEAVAPKAKGLSKTAAFKKYRGNGGMLSWKKWQDAGMPEAAEVAEV